MMLNIKLKNQTKINKMKKGLCKKEIFLKNFLINMKLHQQGKRQIKIQNKKMINLLKR